MHVFLAQTSRKLKENGNREQKTTQLREQLTQVVATHQNENHNTERSTDAPHHMRVEVAHCVNVWWWRRQGRIEKVEDGDSTKKMAN